MTSMHPEFPWEAHYFWKRRGENKASTPGKGQEYVLSNITLHLEEGHTTNTHIHSAP